MALVLLHCKWQKNKWDCLKKENHEWHNWKAEYVASGTVWSRRPAILVLSVLSSFSRFKPKRDGMDPSHYLSRVTPKIVYHWLWLAIILILESVTTARGWQCCNRPGSSHIPICVAPVKSWRWLPRKGGLRYGRQNPKCSSRASNPSS